MLRLFTFVKVTTLRASTKALLRNQVIAEGCHENGIGIVKINDVEEAEEYGLTEMPVVVLFENRVPTVFTGDIEDEDEVLVRISLFDVAFCLLW